MDDLPLLFVREFLVIVDIHHALYIGGTLNVLDILGRDLPAGCLFNIVHHVNNCDGIEIDLQIGSESHLSWDHGAVAR